MHPELFHFHYFGQDRSVYSYGMMMLAGMAGAIALGAARARRHGMVPFDAVALGLLCAVGGVVGAWLLYVGVHFREFLAAPLVHVKQPGLVFYGGFIGAIGVAWAYCRGYKISFLAAADLAAGSLPLGHALGRVGCFLAGCCYGRPTGSPLGVTFTDPHAPASRLCALAGPIHPVQLYESVGLLAITAIIVAAERRPRAPGALFLLYLGLYAVLRLIMEGLRGDFVERGYLVPGLLTTSQAIGVLMLAAAAALYLLLLRRKGRTA